MWALPHNSRKDCARHRCEETLIFAAKRRLVTAKTNLVQHQRVDEEEEDKEEEPVSNLVKPTELLKQLTSTLYHHTNDDVRSNS